MPCTELQTNDSQLPPPQRQLHPVPPGHRRPCRNRAGSGPAPAHGGHSQAGRRRASPQPVPADARRDAAGPPRGPAAAPPTSAGAAGGATATASGTGCCTAAPPCCSPSEPLTSVTAAVARPHTGAAPARHHQQLRKLRRASPGPARPTSATAGPPSAVPRAAASGSASLTASSSSEPPAASDRACCSGAGRAALHTEPSLALHLVRVPLPHWVQKVRTPSTCTSCWVLDARPRPTIQLAGTPSGRGGGTTDGAQGVHLQVRHVLEVLPIAAANAEPVVLGNGAMVVGPSERPQRAGPQPGGPSALASGCGGSIPAARRRASTIQSLARAQRARSASGTGRRAPPPQVPPAHPPGGCPPRHAWGCHAPAQPPIAGGPSFRPPTRSSAATPSGPGPTDRGGPRGGTPERPGTGCRGRQTNLLSVQTLTSRAVHSSATTNARTSALCAVCTRPQTGSASEHPAGPGIHHPHPARRSWGTLGCEAAPSVQASTTPPPTRPWTQSCTGPSCRSIGSLAASATDASGTTPFCQKHRGRYSRTAPMPARSDTCAWWRVPSRAGQRGQRCSAVSASSPQQGQPASSTSPRPDVKK